MNLHASLIDQTICELELATLVATFREQYPEDAHGVSDAELRADFLQIQTMGTETFAREVLGYSDAEIADLIARAAQLETELI